jgi:hypothetical protein
MILELAISKIALSPIVAMLFWASLPVRRAPNKGRFIGGAVMAHLTLTLPSPVTNRLLLKGCLVYPGGDALSMQYCCLVERMETRIAGSLTLFATEKV